MVEVFVEACRALASPDIITYLLIGSSIGLIFGAMPGLGGTVALALATPFAFVFGMEPQAAMFLFAGLMGSIAFGGSIPAILLNAPGTASNAASAFDGFPMTQQGQGAKALGISATASGLGATVGLVVLASLLPAVRAVVLLIGPPELFMIILFGLVAVAFAVGRDLIKGLASAGLGVLLSFVGFSTVFGSSRFTCGSWYLWDGIQLIPFLVGIFAFSQVINYMTRGGTIARAEQGTKMGGSSWEGVKEVFRHKVCFLRSSAVGLIIGLIPGVGGAVANLLSYNVALQSSKHPQTFGKGQPEGLIASEAANDAKDGGALLPTVGFGVPGSSEMAVLLGAFILFGLTPGPLLIRDHLDIVFTLILGLFVSNMFASTFGLLMARFLAKLTFINVRYICPFMMTVCFVGVFSVRGHILDVVTLLLCGLLGYGIDKFGFSKVCLVIGFILGVLAERAFFQSLAIGYGSYTVFFTRPISLAVFIGIILTTVFSMVTMRRRGGKSERD